jgi:plastocyanin
MKKLYVLIFSMLLFAFSVKSATITISVSGFTFTPSLTNAAVGDTLNFPNASFTHPHVQVSQATWMASGATPLAGGWGTKTSAFTYVITAPGDIYYVCANHVGSGMKGLVVVSASSVSEVNAQANLNLLTNMINGNELTVNNSSGKNSSLLIFDMSGKQVQVNELTAETRQSVAVNLPKGIYLYRFITEGRISPSGKLYIK